MFSGRRITGMEGKMSKNLVVGCCVDKGGCSDNGDVDNKE